MAGGAFFCLGYMVGNGPFFAFGRDPANGCVGTAFLERGVCLGLIPQVGGRIPYTCRLDQQPGLDDPPAFGGVSFIVVVEEGLYEDGAIGEIGEVFVNFGHFSSCRQPDQPLFFGVIREKWGGQGVFMKLGLGSKVLWIASKDMVGGELGQEA